MKVERHSSGDGEGDGAGLDGDVSGGGFSRSEEGGWVSELRESAGGGVGGTVAGTEEELGAGGTGSLF